MKNIQFDFIKNSRYTVILSLALLVLGLVSFLSKGGLELGIDFAGGKNIRIKVASKVPMNSEKLRGIFAEMQVSPGITNIGDPSEQEYFISYQEKNSVSEDISKLLNQKIGEGKWTLLSEDFVGPKIGKEFQKIAIQATLLILVILMIYIGFRFEIKFGVAAIIALLHDVLISLGLVSLIGFQFDIPLLAAILTIIGYSLNDTIVIFDRIREESKALHLDKHEYVMVVNTSIIKSLTRTMLTSLTTLMALGVLIAFGGVELKPMAIILSLGIIIGTYSSNFIASPVLVLWEKFFGNKKKKKKEKKA